MKSITYDGDQDIDLGIKKKMIDWLIEEIRLLKPMNDE